MGCVWHSYPYHSSGPTFGGIFFTLISKRVHALRAKPVLQMENSEVTGLQLQTKQPNVFTKATLIYLFLQGFDSFCLSEMAAISAFAQFEHVLIED